MRRLNAPTPSGPGEARRAARGQDVVGAGGVVAERGGAGLADEDAPGDPRQQRARRRPRSEARGARARRRRRGSSAWSSDGASTSAIGASATEGRSAREGLQLIRDLRRAGREVGRGDDDRAVRAVLGLRERVQGDLARRRRPHPRRRRARRARPGRRCRPCRRAGASPRSPRRCPARRRRRPGRSKRCRSPSAANGLGAADRVDLVAPADVRGGEHSLREACRRGRGGETSTTRPTPATRAGISPIRTDEG